MVERNRRNAPGAHLSAHTNRWRLALEVSILVCRRAAMRLRTTTRSPRRPRRTD